MADALGLFFEYADENDGLMVGKLWHFFGKCDSWDTIELDGVVLALSLVRFWYFSGRLFFPGQTARQQAFALWFQFTKDLDQSTEPP